MRDFLGSTSYVSNFLALFLIALLIYTVAAKPAMTTSIKGVTTGMIGAITGFYFKLVLL